MIESRESRVESHNSGTNRRARSKGNSFPLPPSAFRLGISLTEVLIAMGIMTVGLLGVASVFPVGSWYMQKAEIADRGSAIAQSVMNDLVTRGMLNPDAWFVMTPYDVSATAINPNYRFPAIDGKYTPVKAPIPGTFTRPFMEALKEGLKQNSNPVVLSKQFGHAYVIDPFFVASASTNTATVDGRRNVAAYAFPASAYASYPWPSSKYYGTGPWEPWRASNKSLTGEKTWPIRRVTFQSTFSAQTGQPGWPMDKPAAESLSRINDDIAYEFPQRADRPAMQNWDKVLVGTNEEPLARKWTGDYSWIATVVPPTNAARNGMARNPEGFEYEVSVVVFYKRTMPANPPANPGELPEAALYERAVSAAVLSTGPSGGELLLTDQQDSSRSPFEHLKTGQWIMLCGPHPNSYYDASNPAASDPRFVLKWYQVLSIDKSGAGVANFDPAFQRVVAVRGAEWPWQPASSPTYSTLSNDLCVGICRGAVAVHTKSMRLESSLGSAFGSGMSVVTPQKVTTSVVNH
jgi:hypothetical protein